MSDMKCPFCQQKMRRTNGTHNKVGVWQCQNSNDPDNVCIASGYLFNDDVLNYINRTRKALDIAVDALKECLSNANNSMALDAVRFHCIKNTANKALEQINEIKGGK